MIHSCLVLFVALAQGVDGPPSLADDLPPVQDDPELRREIEKKTHAFKELHLANKAEEAKVKAELAYLWSKLNGPIPQALSLGARGEYGLWDHDLRLGRGPGLEATFAIGSWTSYNEEGLAQRFLFTPLPAPDAGMLGFGIRYFNGRDERAGGRVDVWTYEIVRIQFDGMWPHGVGFGYSFTFGLTRLSSRRGDRDTALDFLFDLPNVKFQLHPNVRIGAGLTWDVMRTTFNMHRTHTVTSLFPSLSFDANF
jgi:hypothetical protein